ncbi:MAG: M42 family metallopeptidase [bacterium]|nr:M42 family metallopeptidase [bacterium]
MAENLFERGKKEWSCKESGYMLRFLEKIVNIPSPSGYTKRVLQVIEQEAASFGYQTGYNRKGGLLISVEGRTERVLGVSAHADTLGAMVRAVRKDGTLAIVPVGGFMMEAIEGSYCQILTREGKEFSGTIQTVAPSVHTFDNARSLERKEKNMEVRLDERVFCDEDVKKLGIGAGDFISFAPKFEYTESGFIKSRHLDDKASVAVILAYLKYLSENQKKPEQTLRILISNYEEVGFGGSAIPQDIEEFLAIDMGAIGDDLNGNEYAVSICAKDSSGPYDFDMTNRLIALAKEYDIDYTVDIFPHYGSDVSAALKAGNDIRGALIGQGVSASHGMERTHISAMEQTWKLLAAYTGVLDSKK